MSEREELLAELRALREYVTELEESGVDLIPLDMAEPATEESESARVPVAAEPEPVYATSPESTVPVQEGLNDIRLELGECHRCQLGSGRTNLVFGVGNPKARLVFVGEAPGRDEDLQGEPFVGKAGQLLTKMIEAMGFSRSEVYIANVVKCRPPENRDPEPEEIEACEPFLKAQIDAIRPKVIVTLGRTPTDHFVPGREGMTSRRGRFGSYLGIPVMPTFHPSYLIRNEGNRELRRMVWEDIAAAPPPASWSSRFLSASSSKRRTRRITWS